MSTDTNPELNIEEKILSSLRRISRAISLYSSHVQKEHGLTGPQLMLLREVQKKEAITVRLLANSVSLSHATVTGILDRLQSKGLVNRTALEQDKRKRVVTLTEEGGKLLKKAPPPMQTKFRSELEKLEGWEQTQILSSLQRVAQMMSAEELSAAPLLMTEEGDKEEWRNIGILHETAADK